MRCVVVLVVAAACGSVSGKKTPDASTSDAPPTGDAATPGNGTLSLADASRWVQQNGSVSEGFGIQRTAMGPLVVHVTGLPAGVTAPDVTVTGSDVNGMLTFSAASSAQLGSITNVMVELHSGNNIADTKPFTIKVSGAPGTLDTTWGTNGVRTVPLPDPALPATTGNGDARAAAVYTSGTNAGKLVVAAQLVTSGPTSNSHRVALMRFNVDGTPDTGFGTAGTVLIDDGAAHGFYPVAVAIDSAGRIVLASSFQDTSDVCEVDVKRYLSNGTVDSAFQPYTANPAGGFCGTPVGQIVFGGNSIVVAAYWNNPDTSQLPLLFALNDDGTPMSRWLGAGNVDKLPNPAGTAKPVFLPQSVAIDQLGRFVLPGLRCDGGWNTTYSNCESTIGVVKSDGTWATTFGPSSQGFTSLTFGNQAGDTQRFMAVDPNYYVAVGFAVGGTQATLAKFTMDGAVDTTFGTSGRITPTLVGGATSQSLDDIAIEQPVDGQRIYAIGDANSGGSLVVATRYSITGVLDTTYGTNGVATTPGVAEKGLLTPDGRLVVVGYVSRVGGGYDVALWRFWP
jgi:uncharacterized delta-60 repeat protein